MRGTLVLTLTFACTALLAAAPGDVEDRAGAPALPLPEARAFAQQLVGIVGQVSATYVRPVPRAQLLHAALSGLYETVDQPVPDTIKGELEKYAKDLPGGAEDDLDALMQRMAKSEELVEIVTRWRAQLGAHAALQGPAGLRISVQALTRCLDPYSMLIDNREVRRSNGESIHFGLGIELDSQEIAGPRRIKTVYPGSPAQRAGVRPGDRITQLFSKSMDEYPASMIALLDENGRAWQNPTAPPPSEIVQKPDLTIHSAGKDAPRHVKLQRSEYRPETVFGVRRRDEGTWSFLLDERRKLGYLRIGSLDHGSGDEVQQALSRLKAEQLSGLILDLRWSPGGFLNEAVWIARLFLAQGEIATVRSRRKQDDQVFRAEADGPYTGFPMIVLVNGETMGGAELIAAALQDNNRAKVAGQRSFGKASVQTVLPLTLGELGLKLTTGSFVRPSGKALHRFPDSKPADDWGVRPDRDLEVRLSSDLSQQLRDWYVLHALRPGTSTEASPLDDPEKDPQRQRALLALLEMVKD